MADNSPVDRFLVVRLGSLGDVVHALPAVAALRDTFPSARIDWLIERKWLPLLASNPSFVTPVPLDRRFSGTLSAIRALRQNAYTCVIDFQGLYKSALFAFLSGAPRRIGFDRASAREGGAALFYTQHVSPSAPHIIDQFLSVAAAAGARSGPARFPLVIPEPAQSEIARRLAGQGITEYLVVSPGGGWRSKCWPPERYGELCRTLERDRGLRAIINFGPDEEALAEAVCRAAGPASPVRLETDLPQLMALLSCARLVVAADTGPLHLAVALGTPVVALFGPTTPRRNGPYSPADVVVQNAALSENTHSRGREFAASMLSITVEQVLAAVATRLERAR